MSLAIPQKSPPPPKEETLSAIILATIRVLLGILQLCTPLFIYFEHSLLVFLAGIAAFVHAFIIIASSHSDDSFLCSTLQYLVAIAGIGLMLLAPHL